MPFEDNNGSVNYPLSCGIATDVGWNPEDNNGSAYYGLSSNDYILWCQETIFPPVTSNNGSDYYFYSCGLSSDAGDFTENNDTKFYYSSAFNDVSFCP